MADEENQGQEQAEQQEKAEAQEKREQAQARKREKAAQAEATAEDKARNAEALGTDVPGEHKTASTPINPEAPANAALAEEQERGYIGGQPFEERLDEERRQARIRAGLVPDVGVGRDA